MLRIICKFFAHNSTIPSCYQFRCLMNRGTMGVNCLPKAVTRHRSGTVQVNWSRPTDSGSTENARLENRKLFKKLFKLLYLRFPSLQIRTCVFHTCIFHPCIFVLTYYVLAYSILRYFRFPYLRFQSPPFYSVLSKKTTRMVPYTFRGFGQIL